MFHRHLPLIKIYSIHLILRYIMYIGNLLLETSASDIFKIKTTMNFSTLNFMYIKQKSNCYKYRNYVWSYLPLTVILFSRNETGEDSYLVPIGGSNIVGLYGYLTAFQEMISQVLKDINT